MIGRADKANRGSGYLGALFIRDHVSRFNLCCKPFIFKQTILRRENSLSAFNVCEVFIKYKYAG